MAHHRADLNQLEQALRMEICKTCPYRSEILTGQGIRRRCEKDCPLFVQLPVLERRAEKLDPLIGGHESALLSTMKEMIEREEDQKAAGKEKQPSKLRRHRRKAAKILAKLINP